MLVFITDEQYQIAEKNGISKANVNQRIRLGWTVQRAITEPIHKKGEIKPEHIYYVRRESIAGQTR